MILDVAAAADNDDDAVLDVVDGDEGADWCGAV